MSTFKRKALPPGPNTIEMLKVLYDVKTQGTGPTFIRLRETYGDFVYLPIFKRYVIFNPVDIKYVLKDNKKNFVKSQTIEFVKTFLGEGLATSEGDLWKKQRRNVGREFHVSSLKGYTSTMTQITSRYLEKWAADLKKDPVLDVSQELLDLTFDIACEIFFGIKSGAQTREMRDAFVVCADMAVKRGRSLIPMPDVFMKRQIRKEKEALDTLDRIVFDIIGAHQQSEGDGFNNVMTKLLNYVDEESGEKMPRKQLRDELITILAGGFERTCNALIWTIYLLAKNPDCYEKAEREVDMLMTSTELSMEQLAGFKYLTQCFQESMRLYPPFPVLSRRNLAADRIGGVDLEAGQHIYIMPYVTHRDPDYFSDPERFDPERFSSDRKLNEQGVAYFPFGEGQRRCIGENYAMIEAIVLLAMILKNFHFEVLPGFKPEPKFSITLYSANGMPMKVVKRQ